jgi:dipeptidyl aminopeptidase/acylaminoacyl peptidase
LAELGFIVVVIEGTSNPLRSKSFHDMNYGNMAENTLPDQITGIKQLAAQYPIDTTKVGIWGHSGGGFATAAAMFRYPDFFKVGISESGNHENRNYEDDWGERYNGLVENSDYDAQANQNFAKNLKGKLMLAHGMMDNNVPPYNTLLVVEALEKANKSFDLVIFPNSPHGYGALQPLYDAPPLGLFCEKPVRCRTTLRLSNKTKIKSTLKPATNINTKACNVYCRLFCFRIFGAYQYNPEITIL